MFENLKDKLAGVFDGLAKRGALREGDVDVDFYPMLKMDQYIRHDVQLLNLNQVLYSMLYESLNVYHH